MFGHGTFVYNPDYALQKFGSEKSVTRALLNMGMSHAWIRGHNKNGLWKVKSNKRLIDAFRSENISVGVWGWCDGNDVRRDVKNVRDALLEFDPDSYIADIENGVSGASWNAAKSKMFGREVRSAIEHRSFVVSSFGYINWHEPDIMSALDEYADYFAPQVYWFWYPNQKMLNQTPIEGLRLKNAADYARACIYHWSKVVSKPLVLTGQAYWGEHSGWTQTRAEEKLEEFLQDFDEYRVLAGVNWWNFAADKAMSKNMEVQISSFDIEGSLRSAKVGEGDYEGKKPETPPAQAHNFDHAGLHWVAAEGLKFRSRPDAGSDDNVLQSLDYGASAIVIEGPMANGYVKATVAVDGEEIEGYLFSKYLRKNERPKIERAIQEAVSEWIRFDKGNGVEYRSPYSDYINEMWTARGYPNLTGKDRDWFWSAAFISWILENAGYERTEFDIRHSTYIHESIQNRVLGRERDFWGYRLDEAKPQVGDILCQWRGKNETTYDQAETKSRFPSHADIIIAVRDRAVVTLGGNVANAASNGFGVSVETKTFRRDVNGLMTDERRLFAIMKNQFRPKSKQLLNV
ncbi:DUF2272 domain-containing protein [Cribrihabitans neustonicus]|uniref:DUF2272 domain-containing protein n=1 Tax=Cribrihabitans neustonicus TaxID=1429085 RepID=UPI003B59E88E